MNAKENVAYDKATLLPVAHEMIAFPRRIRYGDDQPVDCICRHFDPDRASQRSVKTVTWLAASRRLPNDRPGHVFAAPGFVQVDRGAAADRRRPASLISVQDRRRLRSHLARGRKQATVERHRTQD